MEKEEKIGCRAEAVHCDAVIVSSLNALHVARISTFLRSRWASRFAMTATRPRSKTNKEVYHVQL